MRYVLKFVWHIFECWDLIFGNVGVTTSLNKLGCTISKDKYVNHAVETLRNVFEGRVPSNTVSNKETANP